MKFRQKVENKKDWRRFTYGYLRLAELAFTEIIESKHKKNEIFKIEEIFIPALFNLKHAIEIFLKNFSIEFLDIELLDESYNSHNIEKLFSAFRKKIEKKVLKNIIQEYLKKFPKEKEEVNEKNILDELENIVKKYHSLEILKNKINADFSISDINNTALRYPSNDLSIILDYEKISEKFLRKDAYELLIDTIKLEAIFWQFYTLILFKK